jgi:hypothetical protein
MADATTEVFTDRSGLVPAQSSLGCAANVLLLAGTIVTADASGNADVPTAGQHAVGIPDATFDNRTTAPEGGGAGAVIAEISHGVFTLAYTGTAPVVNAKLKTIMYVVDNQTVSTDSNSGARGVCGLCVDVIDATYCKVLINPGLNAILAHTTSTQIDLDTAEATLAALVTEVGDYTGGGGAEADIATGVVQAETDITALQTEVGDYTGGGGAEADIATGVVQAETDITALETDATSAQAFVQIPLNAIRLATGAALPAYSDGVDGLTLQDSEFHGIRFNDGVHTAMSVSVPLPPDLDETADVVVHALGARIGTADTDAALAIGAFFQTVGADYDADADAGGNTSAFDAAATKEVSEVTLTIAAANVPAVPCQLSLTIASHTTLDADDLVVGSLWLEYTRKLRTS